MQVLARTTAGWGERGGERGGHLWVRAGNGIGDAVWGLGVAAPKAAILDTIDHGPLPDEASKSTVYLSNHGSPGKQRGPSACVREEVDRLYDAAAGSGSAPAPGLTNPR